ncbi:helix-turn-helix domain-containing protein [Fredinandcohnia sp. QZ13]|uniref:TetR/AcrR family transcriptional regulator n=1 Tax=Fredinandcohnia sp. QZ13 TaxID=3073144 RepID=UPI0028532DC5|nr:helix-turn-helix domain-containing protein [Fredinandcohnia sp. QZ13]MDR4888048.1 helix-turn-helix domain-containing protein [Fredinandcohnia sp. QZ13]
MYSKFFNLDQEKQERILNAATKEFAEKNYVNASTNEIVKQAGISKGLLFHYFKNKKELYLFLYDYYLEVMVNDLFANIDLDEPDIFNKYRSITLIKFELMKKHPEMFNFVRLAFEEDSPEIKIELEKRNKDVLKSSYTRLANSIDVSKFKEGIDVQKAMNIIFWSLEAFGYQKQEQTKAIPLDQLNSEDLIKEMDEYIEMLKLAFYK